MSFGALVNNLQGVRRQRTFSIQKTPVKSKLPPFIRLFIMKYFTNQDAGSKTPTNRAASPVNKKPDPPTEFVIMPDSRYIQNFEITYRFYSHWMIILGCAVLYYLLYIPYSIVFEYHALFGELISLDVICLLVFFFDIFINANTAFLHK
jgi:hypothetical protein